MWLLLAFLSAALLGFYDAFKKQALKDNAVLPVLFLNTVFSSLIFLPFILISVFAPAVSGGTMFDVPVVGWDVHKFIIIKSFIVLSSWIFGYFGMKHLPLTIVGPINATRPVMVLVGAMLVFGERLNLYQWIGVMLAVLSFFMLSRSGKKEGIDFKHNKWILFIVLAAVTGAVSGLYDKYLMKQLPPMVVQSWYNIYQVFITQTCTVAGAAKTGKNRLCRACGFHPGPRKSRCRDSGTAKRRSGGTVPGHPQAFRKGAGSRPVPHHRRTVFPGDRRNSGKKRKLGADYFLPRQIKTQRGAESK